MTMPAGLLGDNGLPGSPSAIATLLQTLTQPKGMPGPQQTPSAGPSTGPITAPPSAPVPTQTAPSAPAGGGMMDRIHDWLTDHLPGMTPPAGYEGLLSSDEIKSARPSLLSSIIGGPNAESPAAKYRENLNNIVGMKQLAATMAENRRIIENRRSIESKYPLPPNPTMDDLRNNLAQRYDAYIGAGDADMAKEIGASLRGIMTAPKPDVNKVLGPGSALVDPKGNVLAKTDAVEKNPIVGSPEWKAAEDFKAQLAAKYKVEPTQILQGVDENGDPAFFRVPKSGGDPVKIGGMAPRVTVKTENAQQELTRARAEAAVSEMNSGVKVMQDFENKLKSGQAKIGNVGQIVGSIANTFTHDDPASKAIQNTALTLLNKSNPEFARYIRRALSFAEAESMISSRPSDFRTRMSAFLSSVANGADPSMIDDISARRDAILNPLNRIYSAKASAPAPRASAPPVSAPKSGVLSYEEWKAKRGKP